MRRFALGLLVVSGLSFGCTPPAPAPTQPAAPAGGPAPTSGSTSALAPSDSSVKLVSLKVEGMHCPYSCYPNVKKTLESVAGVDGVELAPQKDSGAIDNPVVTIKPASAFDSSAAIAALEKAGFKGEVVN